MRGSSLENWSGARFEDAAHQIAVTDLIKCAMKQPKAVNVPKKKKNIERDAMGSKLGRIHMHKQDFSKLVTRSRFKGLKRGRAEADSGANEAEASQQ